METPLNLKILSLNVNGSNNILKRNSLLQIFKKSNSDIIFILKDVKIWNREWGNNNGIFSHGTKSSKGVAILFSNRIIDEIKIIKSITDENGRYALCDVKYGDIIITLVNVYMPLHKTLKNSK